MPQDGSKGLSNSHQHSFLALGGKTPETSYLLHFTLLLLNDLIQTRLESVLGEERWDICVTLPSRTSLNCDACD